MGEFCWGKLSEIDSVCQDTCSDKLIFVGALTTDDH